MWLPRRIRRSRAASRHLALRDFAAGVQWPVVGLSTNFAGAVPIEPLASAASAQAELAAAGERDGWTMTTALVATVSAGRPRKQGITLVTILDLGVDDRQFVARRSVSGTSVVPLSHAPAYDLEPVRRMLASPGGLSIGDSVALSDLQLVHAHPMSLSTASVPVVASVELLVRLAHFLNEDQDTTSRS